MPVTYTCALVSNSTHYHALIIKQIHKKYIRHHCHNKAQSHYIMCLGWIGRPCAYNENVPSVEVMGSDMVPWRSSTSGGDSHFLIETSSTFGLHMIPSSHQWLLVVVSKQWWPHPRQWLCLASYTW